MTPSDLLPDIGTCAYVWPDVSDADAARFYRVFRAAWLRLPVVARRVLFGYWIRASTGADLWPRVELVALLHQHDGTARYDVVAVAQCQGCHLLFAANRLQPLSDEEVAAVVAHELGHVLSHAVGGGVGSESVIDEATRRWGFDIDAARLSAGLTPTAWFPGATP